jgi:site-specific DNA-methyltransferase (adenine-specific)
VESAEDRALVPAGIAPGMIPRGWAETILAEARRRVDPADLWHGSLRLGALAQEWNGHGQEKSEVKSAQMFCEILLGQWLGPQPGNHQGPDGKFLATVPHAERITDLIPFQRVSELQRLHRFTEKLLEAVRNGSHSRRSLLLLVDEWEADERIEDEGEPEPEDLDIRRGDFRDVLADIKPDSVALVLTDPPYPAKYLPLWDDLGAWSAQHLVEGGSLIAYSGQSNLFEVGDRLRPHLRYWWTIALMHRQSQMLPGKWVSVGWKPLVWFVRERRATQSMVPDRLAGSPPRKTQPTGDGDDWAQGVEELAPIISGLTAPGDLIVDPFAGSGTVGLAAHRYGRRFIGAEIGG